MIINLILIVAVIIRASTFVVDQRQNAIVFQLGQITRVITEPGLYFRLPLVQPGTYRLTLELADQAIELPPVQVPQPLAGA